MHSITRSNPPKAQSHRPKKLRVSLVAVGLVAVFAACQPTAPPPSTVCTQGTNNENPVIVVAGTFSPEIFNQIYVGNRLHLDGFTYCIFELKGASSFGNLPGTAPIETSAQSLRVFVDSVLAWSGATKVDLVGHSQGALVARHYVKFLGGDTKVDDLVSLSGPNQGTDLAGLVDMFAQQVLTPYGVNCDDVQPCHQMVYNSAYIQNLNAGDQTPGDVDYHAFKTDFDELVWHLNGIVVEHNNAFIAGADNHSVQDECFARATGHMGMALDEVVYEMTKDALTGQSVSVPLVMCALPTFSY